MKDNHHEVSLEPYKGVRDFYPEDMRKVRHIFNTWRRVAESYGYEEYMASLLEPAGLYEAKTGEEIVREQTYRFTDRGDRNVILRPELTPTTARMVAKRRRNLTFPLRWFSIPNVFRYESPQKGRLREHWQLNADLFGPDSLEADFEILSLACDILKAFGAGFETYVVKISDARFLPHVLIHSARIEEAKVPSLIKIIDRRDKLPLDTFNEKVIDLIGNDRFRALTTMMENDGRLTADSMPNEELGGRSAALRERCTARGIRTRTDPFLTRGFDYYTGMIFEVFDADTRNRRSLFGGGRYNDLMEVFGEELVSAVGFGHGDVTLNDFLTTHALWPDLRPHVDVLLCRANGASDDFFMRTADSLRMNGVNVATEIQHSNLGDQVRTAERGEIPYVVCVGAEEEKSKRFRLKHLKERTEVTLSIDEIALRVVR